MSNESSHPVWTRLLDQAHTHFVSGNTKQDSLALLGPLEAQAQVLANLHYQVYNGGFRQWVDNGYATSFKPTFAALQAIGTPAAAKVIAILNALEPFLLIDTEDRGFAGEYWLVESEEPWMSDDEDEDSGFDDYEETCEGWDIAEDSDTIYYALEDFPAEIEAWLASGAPDNSSNLPEPDAPEATPHKAPVASEATPRYPAVRVQISGQDGNALMVIGSIQAALRKAGVTSAERSAFATEATSGDYNHVLRTAMAWVTVS
jgi:hypothetical protein